MPPNFLSGLFYHFWASPDTWSNDLFQFVFNVLSWDVVKGGMAFGMGLGIALFAVRKIREGFGV